MGLAPVPKRPMQLQTIPVDTVASHSGASAPTPQTRTYLPTLCKDKTAPSPRPKLSINNPSNPNLTTQQPKPSKQNAQIQQLLHHHLIRDQFPGTYPLNPPAPQNTPHFHRPPRSPTRATTTATETTLHPQTLPRPAAPSRATTTATTTATRTGATTTRTRTRRRTTMMGRAGPRIRLRAKSERGEHVWGRRCGVEMSGG